MQMDIILQNKMLSGSLFLVVAVVFIYFRGGKRKDSKKLPLISYTMWAAVCTGILLVACGLAEIINADEAINVNYHAATGSIPVTTVSTTLYTTLMTVNLALIALAVTAYIFLIGALCNRKAYEQVLINEMISRRTRELIILSGYTGSFIICCLMIENLNASLLDRVKHGIVLASAADTFFLIIFLYMIINYEQRLCALAIRNIKKTATGIIDNTPEVNVPDNAYETENAVIKKIGDLETFVNQILINHEMEYRYSNHEQEILNNVFDSKTSESKNKEMCCHYERLLKLRNCYLIGRRQMAGDQSYEEKFYSRIDSVLRCLSIKKSYSREKNILNWEQIHKIDNNADVLWEYLKQNILKGERFIDQNLSSIQFNGKKADVSGTSFRNSAISECSYDDANAEGADFSGVLFHNTSMKNTICKNADFSDVKFYDFIISQESDFAGAVFINTDFNTCKIGGYTDRQPYFRFKMASCNKANFVHCEIENVDFESSVFKEALFSNAQIKHCQFKSADFAEAVLAETSLEFCELNHANLEKVTGAYSTWKNCSADNARMARGNYIESKMKDCTFKGAYAHDSSFNGANLENVIFIGAVMNKTDFSNTEIYNCQFAGTNLAEILLTGAGTDKGKIHVRNTDFTDADLTGSQIKNTVFEKCSFTNTLFNNTMLKNVMFRCCNFQDAQFLGTYIMDVEWKDNKECNSFGRFMDSIEFAKKSDQEAFSLSFHAQERDRKIRESPVKEAIFARCSIRNFDESPKIEYKLQKEIVEAGLRAPSPKNRQPWFFTVVDKPDDREAIADIMMKELQKLTEERRKAGKDYTDLDMAGQTANIIRKAPVLIFAGYDCDESNEHGEKMNWKLYARGFEALDLQSIGAAIQNMLLRATELGISSLWIGDVLYVQNSLTEYLKLEYPFVAAVAFGYASQTQSCRKSSEDKAEWFNEYT